MYAECICEASLKLLVTLDSIWLEGMSRKCPSIRNVPKYNHRSLLSISRDEWPWTWCDVHIRWAIRYTDYPQYIIHEFSPLFIVCALLICLLVLIVRWLCSQVNIKYHQALSPSCVLTTTYPSASLKYDYNELGSITMFFVRFIGNLNIHEILM